MKRASLIVILLFILNACDIEEKITPVASENSSENGVLNIEVENYMVNEPTEKELADLAKKLGLSEPKFESQFLNKSLFQGDFGHSIDFRFLMTMLILFFIAIFLIIYKKKKRK